MTRSFRRYFFSVFLICLCVFGLSLHGLAQKKEAHVSNQVLVRFKSHVSSEEKAGLRNDFEAILLQEIQSIRLELWSLPKATDLDVALATLHSSSFVVYAEPNYLYQPQAVPNDPQFHKLWHLQNTGQTVNGQTGNTEADIEIVPAWDLITGDTGIVIAVIDSGVAFDHPDLTDNTWVNTDEIPDNGLDDDGNGYVDDVHGWDFVNADNNPSDYSRDLYGDGHGTHVAGIIGSRGNNAIGGTGVLWECGIMPLQVFDLFQSNTFAANVIQIFRIVQAVDYAVANGADIINCSFGGPFFSQALFDIYSLANEQGVLVIAAAGNNNSDNDQTPVYPAGYELPNIISVAATNEQDELALYSNFGNQTVDMAAPGGSGAKPNIFSTIPPEREVLFSDNFESGLQQWTTQSKHDDWFVDYNFLFDSEVLHSSETFYHNNESSTATTIDPIDAEKARGIHLHMDIEYQLEDNFDFFYIDASQDGTTFTPAYSATGDSFGILHFNAWKSELELGTFYLRFRLETDPTMTDLGVFLDNVKLTGVPWVFDGNEYGTKSGTSMAAPVVSGLAGLVWSLQPDLSHFEVKETLENTVDTSEGLAGKVHSNGRVNAYKALTSLLTEKTLDLDIHEGWNLLGLTVVPDENIVNTLVSGINQSVKSVWKWTNTGWASYFPALGEQEAAAYLQSKGFQKLEAIHFGEGFWINAQTAASFEINGTAPSSALPLTCQPGWNLKSLGGDAVQSITEVINDISNSAVSIWKWDASKWSVFLPEQNDNGTSYAQSKEFGLLSEIKPGEGFWVNCE